MRVRSVSPSEVSDELHAALSSGDLESPPDLRKLFRVGEVQLQLLLLHGLNLTPALALTPTRPLVRPTTPPVTRCCSARS